MKKCTAITAGTAFFALNWCDVALDKIPRGFPNDSLVQRASDYGARPTMVGTTSMYSGMLGIHPFQIIAPVRLRELTPSFVSSFYPP